MTNYSFATSLPAYQENPSGKKKQSEVLFSAIQSLGGISCLKQLANITGLPQSTVAGRINDLAEEGKVIYDGFVDFEGRKRKRIVILREPVQTTLF